MNDLLTHIVFSALSCSAAIALVLAARDFVARHFGPPVAYASWALVPIAALAVLLPARSVVVVMRALPAPSVAVAASPETVVVMPLPPTAGFDAASGLFCLWIAGAVATLLVFLWQQRRFVRSLGRLDALHGGLHRAQTTHGCPVLVGVWRPRIVVPADFESRYTAAERDLILAHERQHRARGDAPANALATLLRSVFWFNPLAHFAASRFLADQELACDAVVIARFPNARRAYADALMKTQLGGGRAALACHWRARNVLRERITTLALPSVGRSRRRLGNVAVAATVLAASVAAWAAQPANTQVHYEQIVGSASATSVATFAEMTTSSIAQTAHAAPQEVAPVQLAESAPAGAANRAEPARRKSLALATQNRNAATMTPVRVAASPESQSESTRARVDVASLPSITAPFAVPSEGKFDDVGSSADADSPPHEIATFRREHAPAYPAAAVRTHLQGSVVLDVHVDANGRPMDARVARVAPATASELASASLAAVTHWQFEPARRGGRAVDGHLDVPFTFALDGQAAYAAPEAHRQASYRTVAAADYTADAAAKGAVVYVRVRIEEDGSVSASSIERVDPASATDLGSAALAALKTWTFNPGRDRDKAVASTAIVPIVFGTNPQTTPAIARIRNLLDPVRVTPKQN